MLLNPIRSAAVKFLVRWLISIAYVLPLIVVLYLYQLSSWDLGPLGLSFIGSGVSKENVENLRSEISSVGLEGWLEIGLWDGKIHWLSV